jgi:hypothetical protein
MRTPRKKAQDGRVYAYSLRWQTGEIASIQISKIASWRAGFFVATIAVLISYLIATNKTKKRRNQIKAGFQFTLRRLGYALLFFGLLWAVTTGFKGDGVGYGIAILVGGVVLIFLGSIKS